MVGQNLLQTGQLLGKLPLLVRCAIGLPAIFCIVQKVVRQMKRVRDPLAVLWCVLSIPTHELANTIEPGFGELLAMETVLPDIFVTNNTDEDEGILIDVRK